METKFKIAKYEKVGDGFCKTGYTEYLVTYLKGIKKNQLRIVVNGYLTKEIIKLTFSHDSYKNRILLAIKEFNETNGVFNNKVAKKLTLRDIKRIYCSQAIKNVENYLINISKEDSRDKLTEVGLITP